MKRALRWIVGVVVVLSLGLILLFAVSRLRGPEPAELSALGTLERQDPPAGRNAFAAMWLLKYDVPEGQQERIAAEDVRRFEREVPAAGPGPGAPAVDAAPFDSAAAKNHALLELDPDEQRLLCQLRDPDCLVRVRENTGAVAKLVERRARLLERTRALDRYGYLRSGFPARMDIPFVHASTVEGVRLARTADALAFVLDRPDEALHNLCRTTRPWRRFQRSANTLLDQMIAVAVVDGAIEVFADMLAELPPDHPLPAACAQAFALAQPEELSLCGAMRGEFRFASGLIEQFGRTERQSGSWLENAAFPLMYDEQKTRARFATEYAKACAPDVLRQIVADQAVGWPPPRGSYFDFACLGNRAGCRIAREAQMPVIDEYQHRMQDHGLKLQMLNTLLWLRAGAGDPRPLAERLAERPPELRSPHREFEVVDGGSALRAPQYETGRAESWDLPLPPYLFDAVPVF